MSSSAAAGADPFAAAPAPSAPGGPGVTRDWLVDALRVGSMVVVVLFHWTLARVTVVGGELEISNPLEGPVAIGVSWVLMVMPLFFVCGGFANTVTLDRVRAGGGGYGAFVALRVRRLMTPLLPLCVVMAALVTVLRLVGMRGMGDLVADHAANVLWFLASYVTCVALTPVLVTLHDRVGWWAPVGLLALGVIAVDLWRYQVEEMPVALANMFFVWLLAHQLGVLHARHTLRRLPTSAVWGVVAAGAAAIVLMVVAGPYADNNIGTDLHPQQNLNPSNASLAVLAVLQLALLTLAARRLAGVAAPGWLRGMTQRGNPLLMLVFLWHMPALFAAIGVGWLIPELLLPESDKGFWLMRPVWYAVCALFLMAFVAGAVRWELRCQQLGVRDVSWTAALGALAGVVGTFLLWRAGFGLWRAGTDDWQWPTLAGQALVVVAVLLTATRSPSGGQSLRVSTRHTRAL